MLPFLGKEVNAFFTTGKECFPGQKACKVWEVAQGGSMEVLRGHLSEHSASQQDSLSEGTGALGTDG